MGRIAALMTSFNRKQKTLDCLASLHQQILPPDTTVTIFLTDDASQDGTEEAVRAAFPQSVLLHGNGNLYWNGGMRCAFGEALNHDFDFYLWVNDDTKLVPNAIACLLSTHDELLAQMGHSPIVVGSTHDPMSGELTYGGVVHASPLRRLKFVMLEPRATARQCDTMNGNCVLISRRVARVVGNISPDFTHAMGDFDYGLRAQSAGISIWVAPGYLGTCSENSVANTWADAALPLWQRWTKMKHVKGLPPREWMVFARRHAGPLWPVFWASPYLRMLMLGFRSGCRPTS